MQNFFRYAIKKNLHWHTFVMSNNLSKHPHPTPVYNILESHLTFRVPLLRKHNKKRFKDKQLKGEGTGYVTF